MPARSLLRSAQDFTQFGDREVRDTAHEATKTDVPDVSKYNEPYVDGGDLQPAGEEGGLTWRPTDAAIGGGGSLDPDATLCHAKKGLPREGDLDRAVGVAPSGKELPVEPELVASDRKPRRFYGVVVVDPVRMSRDAGQVADEIVRHLAGLVGTDVDVRIEITARSGDGFDDEIVRTVTENARTLKFDQHGFEEA